jgi:hypothetical protein
MYIDAKREKAEKRTRSAASAGVIIKKGVPPPPLPSAENLLWLEEL